MLNFPPAVCIWLCRVAVDLRRSFDGLADVKGIAEQLGPFRRRRSRFCLARIDLARRARDDRPVMRQARQPPMKGRGMIAFLNRHRRLLMNVGFASLALGAVSAFYLPDLQWRADALAKAPQTITLKDLAA